MNIPAKLKGWARRIRRDAHTLYLVARDPRVPWYVKALALCVAGYALSPVDLIPDFVPVLGYLDDLVLVPAGIWVVVRLVPTEILAEHRASAALAVQRPVSRTAAWVIALIWLACAALTAWLGCRYFLRRA
ncbi:YkvA family protein [Burkholderia multivorans]|uniref:YkvA family protein n=1 Tax=Burkholderia multivorans TaxID=87883 RepID=UPI002157901D|nr:YkvA family protein [Burkholderia multivorans]